ncbi:MAG: type VI secretion system tip protein VgrG [Planctomycetota bacterium]|jgi:type VI secretion system secreted protein VgrG|nr:type VI secretion system tip protein VgrG [Planctomycetota bacterium]
MSYTQDNRPAKITTPLGKDKLLLQTLTGEEALARPFRYEAVCASADHNLDLAQLIGQSVTVALKSEKEKGDTRYFNGVCTSARQFAGATVLAEYRLVIEPYFALLRHSQNCRLFQKKKLPDIVKAVFAAAGLSDYKLSLTGNYPEIPFCVQYNESDFAFVSRLLEQAGAYYYFKHADGKHEITLVDAMSAHATGNGAAAASFLENVLHWTAEQNFVTGKTATVAYDFKNPRGDLAAKKAQDPRHPAGKLEKYLFRGNDYFQSADGEALAQTALESEQARHKTFACQTTARGLATGFTFKLQDCPVSAQNADYLIAESDFRLDTANYENGDDGEIVYAANLRGIPKSAIFRPAIITPRPTVYGLQSAVVVGKKGEEIWTDDYRRVQVQFVWDRDGKKDENSSCWLRVAQIWAGKQFGAVFTPRVGDEVLVEFIGGNPDRPVVVGSLYNEVNRPPYDKSMLEVSGIKTHSSKEGDGFNELRFNDKKDSELFALQAQKDMTTLVKNQLTLTVGDDDHKDTADMKTTVKHDLIGVVENNHADTVKKDQTLTVENNRTRTVKKDETVTIEGNRSSTVKKDETAKVEGARNLTVSKDQTTKIDGARSLTVSKDDATKVSGKRSANITGNDEVAAQEITLTGKTKITLKVGGSTVEISASGITLKSGASSIALSASDITEKAGASKLSLGAAQAALESVQTTVKGTATAELSASGMVTVKGGVAMIN